MYKRFYTNEPEIIDISCPKSGYGVENTKEILSSNLIKRNQWKRKYSGTRLEDYASIMEK